MGLSGNFYNSPFINFPYRQFRNILMEIFSNVYNHSQDKIVTIRIQDTKEHLILKFKNKTDTSTIKESNINFRGKGIDFIKSFINKQQYGYVESSINNENYQIKLFIDKEYVL